MKPLAWILIVACLPLSPLIAQNQSTGQQQALTDNEPVMFTLTIDEEMIKALREGQSLMSTIPAHIRGKVDRIRIEFKPSAVAAPTTPTSPNDNSILKRSTNVETPGVNGINGSGQFRGINSSQSPPLQNPGVGTGLNRSSGNDQQDLTAPNLSGSIWNRAPASSSRSSNSLTPIDESAKGWLFQNRRDSNATVSTNSAPSGIQASSTSGDNYPMNRAAFDEIPRADGLYTGPPAFSRSLPALDVGMNSWGISSSSPVANPTMADKTPTVGSDQVVSKTPAVESSGRQPLASSDDATSRTDDRTQVYLFMLLLCSLGVNIYLGWISRGFYVRYQELAAELRDTFTPSSAA